MKGGVSVDGTHPLAIPADHLQSLLGASINPTVVLRAVGDQFTIVGGNQMWGDLCGTAMPDIMRRTPGVCMSAALVDAIEALTHARKDSEPVTLPIRPDFTVGSSQVQVTVIPIERQGSQRFLVVHATPAVETSDERAENVLAAMAEAVIVVDPDYAITYANLAVETLLGWSAAHLHQTDIRALAHPDSADDLVAQLVSAAATPTSIRLQLATRSTTCLAVEATARLLPDASQQIVLTLRDLTSRDLHEESLAGLSASDALTGLANRQAFSERIEQIANTEQECELTVAFLDLDNFKTINDALGHDQGDAVLQTIAKRLDNAVGSFGLLSRFGGDEFVVATQSKPGSGPAELLHLLELAFADPVKLDGKELHITVSIGVATTTDRAEMTADAMLKAADTAMYEAKRCGKNRVIVYDESLQHQAAARIEVESDLRLAVDRNEFVLHYQPIVDVISGRPVGSEALVRWIHPEKGLVPPNDFIPVAEQTGLIVPLGAWVLNEAVRQTAAWNRTRVSRRALGISVNVSALQLGDPDLEPAIHAALSRHGLDPARLTLEVTESTLMVDRVETMAILERLGATGIRIAIDDFGTGYSSLAYLKRLPANALKIDKAFVDGLGTQPEDTALVTGIVGLASALDLQIVAEGVESETQLKELRRLGCEYSQGYLHSRPLCAEDFEAWIKGQEPDPPARRAIPAKPVSEAVPALASASAARDDLDPLASALALRGRFLPHLFDQDAS